MQSTSRVQLILEKMFSLNLWGLLGERASCKGAPSASFSSQGCIWTWLAHSQLILQQQASVWQNLVHHCMQCMYRKAVFSLSANAFAWTWKFSYMRRESVHIHWQHTSAWKNADSIVMHAIIRSARAICTKKNVGKLITANQGDGLYQKIYRRRQFQQFVLQLDI